MLLRHLIDHTMVLGVAAQKPGIIIIELRIGKIGNIGLPFRENAMALRAVGFKQYLALFQRCHQLIPLSLRVVVRYIIGDLIVVSTRAKYQAA